MVQIRIRIARIIIRKGRGIWLSSKRRRVRGCRANLAFGSAVDRLHIHATTRSRPHSRPTRTAPFPPLPRPIGASTQAAGTRRRNEPTIPRPWTPLLSWLLLTPQHRQPRQPSIEPRSGGTKVGLDVLHLGPHSSRAEARRLHSAAYSSRADNYWPSTDFFHSVSM